MDRDPTDDGTPAEEAGPGGADDPLAAVEEPPVPDSVDRATPPSTDQPIEARVEALAEDALETQVAFDPPEDPDARAMTYLREGLWPAIDAYIDVVSAGDRIDQRPYDHLETAVNVWLELYARCYGEEIESDYPARKVAAVFVDTHNIRDTAQLLTGVPERSHDRSG